ncbi:MAG: flagellar type III secretion system pore protein FliP [Opitutales bacterium]
MRSAFHIFSPRWRAVCVTLFWLACLAGWPDQLQAQTPVTPVEPVVPTQPEGETVAPSGGGINISIDGGDSSDDVGVGIQLLVVMTLLTLAPSMVMLTTCFTRIVIVLGFVRSAIGVNSAPSNQIVIGLSLFLTFFIMAPVWERIHAEAVTPYLDDQIASGEALEIGGNYLKAFMLRHARDSDLEFFLEMSGQGPTLREELPLKVVVPSFVLSELRTAFQMGFLIFVPFLVIDFIVASTLMAMGMMMMPPAIISLPFKLLLFVLVDGWYLVVKSLVQSFAV